MNSSNEIGGYFELELPKGKSFHDNVVFLNTARNSFEYILKHVQPSLIYISKYTCDAMLEPLEKLHIPYEFYRLNSKLEMEEKIQLPKGALIVYANYFGIKSDYSRQLEQIYGSSLVLDCSQAFYFSSNTSSSHIIYSPRKFFGVADGGYAYTTGRLKEHFEVDISYERMGHLLKRIDLGPESAYEAFKENDGSLIGMPIKKMSRLTKRILESVDYGEVKQRRLANFHYLHRVLGSNNKLQIQLNHDDVPMAYPYFIEKGSKLKEKLIQQKIYVPTYWPNVFDWSEESDVEYKLANDILALPIDQRYGEDEMLTIVKAVHEG